MGWLFSNEPKRVSVLGAGPAGLLVAYAASMQGYEVRVFSAPAEDTNGKVAKSELHGCQYLHARIPNLTPKEGKPVGYYLTGSTEGYRRKVYGGEWDGRVSPDEYGPEHPHSAWDLRAAYDRLWRWAESTDILISTRLSASNVSALYQDKQTYVFSTIPASELCYQPVVHKFLTQDIWAMGSREDDQTGAELPYYAPDFTVECNGDVAPRWYRAATVFGHSTLEWPSGAKPPIRGVVPVRKPLTTDCDCWTGERRWHRVGRYGRWQKGVLVHTAYYDTMGVLS